MSITAIDLIKRHEGLRLMPYRCTQGKMTVGWGRNIEDCGISQATADQMLAEDIDQTVDALEHLPFWDSLDEPRRAALTDFHYNVGHSTFKKFKFFLSAMLREDYSRASREMLNSVWANQVGQRAHTLAKIIKSGEI